MKHETQPTQAMFVEPQQRLLERQRNNWNTRKSAGRENGTQPMQAVFDEPQPRPHEQLMKRIGTLEKALASSTKYGQRRQYSMYYKM